MTATITATGYALEAFPLTTDGEYLEGEAQPTEDDAYAQMRRWMKDEGWTYEAAAGGGYYAWKNGQRVYALVIAAR